METCSGSSLDSSSACSTTFVVAAGDASPGQGVVTRAPTPSEDPGARSSRRRAGARVLPWLVGLLACFVLCVNAAFTLRETNLKTLPKPRRLWEDLSYAIQSFLEVRFPDAIPAADEVPEASADEPADVPWWPVRNRVMRLTAREGIKPWEFLRTIPARPFLALRLTHEPEEALRDQGRGRALAVGFRLLGGISPFLVLWLGILAAMPVLLWASVELSSAGHAVGGAVFVVAFASSQYVVDCLTTQFSAVGFYLVGLLALVPLTAYGLLRDQPSGVGLWIRCFAAGSAVAACASCRSSTLFLAPGFVLAVVLASLRRRRGWPSLVIALGLFSLPCLPLWRASKHDVWPTVWEGLGDFDSTKGHVWRDADAFAVLKRGGINPAGDPLYGLLRPASEEFFRRSVLADIRSDPGWYAAILGKRVLVTVFLQKPWSSGREIDPRKAPIEEYYALVSPVEVFAMGPIQVQSPTVVLLIAPTALLLVAWIAPRTSTLGRYGAAVSGPLKVLLCIAVAALPVPVSISTAPAMETRALVLAYLMGAGFLFDALMTHLPSATGGGRP